jgi:hypothetical protein
MASPQNNGYTNAQPQTFAIFGTISPQVLDHFHTIHTRENSANI